MAGGGTPGYNNDIVYIEFATKGNAADFGNLNVSHGAIAGCANNTRGLFQGGFGPSGISNVIDYVTISSLGNAADFGNLTENKWYSGGGASNIRGINMCGFNGPSQSADVSNVIDYVTISTTGNATDFGDATVARGEMSSCVGSSTRLVAGGGTTAPSAAESNVMDYITMATTGNATDFGDLTVSRSLMGGASNSTKGIFAGGETPSLSNVIDKITIASTGNASDYGDLIKTISRHFGGSNGHGGLTGG